MATRPAPLAKNAKLTLLFENTAGAGAQLGGVLSELQTIRSLAAPYVDIPIGYCLDTCHCWVAGFDVASEAGLDAFLIQAEETLGLKTSLSFMPTTPKRSAARILTGMKTSALVILERKVSAAS